LTSASTVLPSAARATEASTAGSSTSPSFQRGACRSVFSGDAPRNGLYRPNAWKVGVSTMRGPSVSTSACSTLTICAMLAIFTRSVWR